jgi:transposase-like protein
MPKKSKRSRRSFSAEFNQAAVDLVVKPPYSFKAAAAAVGVAVKSLSELAREAASEARTCRDDASTAVLRDEIKRLMKRPQRAEMEREILKSHGVSFEGVTLRYAWIKEHRDSFSVMSMCRTLEVSPSGYYTGG